MLAARHVFGASGAGTLGGREGSCVLAVATPTTSRTAAIAADTRRISSRSRGATRHGRHPFPTTDSARSESDRQRRVERTSWVRVGAFLQLAWVEGAQVEARRRRVRGIDSRLICRPVRWAALPLLVSLFGTAQAASFDCAKAGTTIEKLICSEPGISRLDTQLARSYKKALTATPSREAVKAWQKNWLLFTRDHCTDTACLTKAYTTQIAELDEHAASVSPSSPLSGKYERHSQGKRDTNQATIVVLELKKSRVRLIGNAIWVHTVETGDVNTGEINGLAQITGSTIRYQDPANDNCSLEINLTKDGLNIRDEKQPCGGMNVTFGGEYRRSEPNPPTGPDFTPREDCGAASTQLEMNLCNARAAKRAEALLEALLKELGATLENTQRDELLRVQNMWVKYRDAHCEWQASFFEGGSIQPTMHAGCIAALTAARIDELRTDLCEGAGMTNECEASARFDSSKR